MKYLLILLLATSAYAEEAYICKTPYVTLNFAVYRYECNVSERYIRRAYTRTVKQIIADDYRANPIRRRIQKQRDAEKEAVDAIVCSWGDLKQ